MRTETERAPRHARWGNTGIHSRDRSRRAPWLALAVGGVLFSMAPAAEAQLSSKQIKAECTGAPTPGCNFVAFLVPQTAGQAIDCTGAHFCTTPLITAPNNTCAAADTTIANTFSAPVCAAALGVPVVAALPTKNGATPGFTWIEKLAFTPTKFYQVCMQDDSGGPAIPLTGAALNNGRISGPYPPVNMCGLTYQVNKKLKYDSPALPAPAVWLLGMGLAAGGWLLRRRLRRSV